VNRRSSPTPERAQSGARATRSAAPPTGVEQPADHHPTVLTAAQLETPGLDRADVLGEHPGGIGCMARVGAVEPEAPDRVLDGELEERVLVEPLLTSRALGRAGSDREQRQVGEPDPPLAVRGDTRGQLVGLLRSRSSARRRCRTSGTGADPVDRRRRTLGHVLISKQRPRPRERRGISSPEHDPERTFFGFADPVLRPCGQRIP
jgi:hypothetical protein